MDFALTADQKMMQESLARTLADASSLERVRRFAGCVMRNRKSAHTSVALARWKTTASFRIGTPPMTSTSS